MTESVYPQGVPSNAHERLNDAIKASSGLQFDYSIDRWDQRDGDESTGVKPWRLDAPSYGLSCTEEQRDAARAVMAAFDPWGDGSDIGALSEDEDPGEQDLGAEMLAAQDEAGENPQHELQADPEPLREENDATPEGLAVAADGGDVLYPGIAILPDELGARRNAVLAAIATEKLTRLSIAMDPSRADFLAARFADYQNAGALGLPIDEALAADYRAFQELRDRRDRITNYAMHLEQSALDGDMERLEAMHVGLGEGWPT